MTILFTSVLAILILFVLWRFYFLRDPAREIPDGNIVVSPADGYVVYVKQVDKGEIPIAIKKERKIKLSEINEVEEYENVSGLLVGIFMTPFSVHRNRAPVNGEVVVKKYYKNKLNLSMIRVFVETLFRFKKYSDNEFYLTNERLTTGIKTEKGIILITQIADEWINRIVSWVNPGDVIKRGHQYGMIRFGSQCDIFIPDTYGINIKVDIGQYVHAGETILGDYTP